MMAQLLLKHSHGYIRNELQAERILLILALILLGLAFMVFPSGNDKVTSSYEAPPGTIVVYPNDGPPRLEKIK